MKAFNMSELGIKKLPNTHSLSEWKPYPVIWPSLKWSVPQKAMIQARCTE